MNNVGEYYLEINYVKLEINDLIKDIGYYVTVSVDSTVATTMMGFDNTYIINLFNNQNVSVGICYLVIDNFTIKINDESTTSLSIFVDYTTIYDDYKSLGLSKIFILFQVLLSIQLGRVYIVSHDVALHDGINRYSRYLFNNINGDIWYNSNYDNLDGYESDNEEYESEVINNILLLVNIDDSKNRLIENINRIKYYIKYLKYKKNTLI